MADKIDPTAMKVALLLGEIAGVFEMLQGASKEVAFRNSHALAVDAYNNLREPGTRIVQHQGRSRIGID